MKTYNRVKVSLGSTGTGSLYLGEPFDGAQSFADAGVPGGSTVSYVIEDGDNWEVGTGVYDAANVRLTGRTPHQSSDEGDPIDASATAILFLAPNASDYAAIGTLVQVYDASGIWTKPTGAKLVYMLAICGGAGGGSGGVVAAGTICAGASGGGGGAFTEATHDAASLPASLRVTVGAGGAGGASVTAGAGNSGAAGGHSYVQSLDAATTYCFTAVIAPSGGQGGAPGSSQVLGGAGGGSTLYHTQPGGAGGQGQNVNSGAGSIAAQRGSAGGSGGGGLDAAATPRPGKDGQPGPIVIYGNLGALSADRPLGGVAPGGNAAPVPAPKSVMIVGGSGGGGASNNGGGNGGAGAAGTVGGGGGGGGSCVTGGTSGAGGAGGPGRVVIVTYF